MNEKYILSNTNKIIFLSNWIQQMFFYKLKNVNLENVISYLSELLKKKILNCPKKKKYFICWKT